MKESALRRGPALAALVITTLLAVIFGTNRLAQLPEIHPTHPPFITFPTTLGTWQGRQADLAPDIRAALQLSDYWLADYRSDNEAMTVNFYIAYYDSQRIGSTTHSPSNCIPGGGWQIDQSTIKSVQVAPDTTLRVTELVIRNGEAAQLVYYWFDERGRNLTETTIAKWYLLQDSLLMHRTDGALVRLVTTFARDEAPDAAEARLNHFLSLAYPAINNFIPGVP